MRSRDWSFLFIYTLLEFSLARSIARPQTVTQICSFNLSNAFVFIYFQAVERLTRIMYDASDALRPATRQETVPALGRAPEMSTVEPVLPGPPDTLTSLTSLVSESNFTPVLSSQFFEEKISDIAQIHLKASCLSLS